MTVDYSRAVHRTMHERPQMGECGHAAFAFVSAEREQPGWVGSCRSALKRNMAEPVSTRPAFSRPNPPPHNGVAHKGRCQ